MAKTRGVVLAFLYRVFTMVHPRAETEIISIAELLKDGDQIDMKSWEIQYGRTLLKSQLLPGFDPKDARQYFAISKALSAMQKITQDPLRVRFEPIENAEAWHSSISACLVYDASTGQD